MAVGAYVAQASLAAARAENPEAAVADYRRVARELMAANRQIAAVGNNLNQLVRHLNAGRTCPETETVRRLLGRIESAVDELDEAVGRVLGR